MDRPSSSHRDGPTVEGAAVEADDEVVWWRRKEARVGAIVGGACLFVVLAVLVAFGPIARARVAKEADKRKLDVTVGGVRPGFFAVTLKDVAVKPRGVDGVKLVLDEVRVELGASLSVREVVAHGGRIDIDGEPEDVVQRLKDFRKNTGEKEAPSTPSGKHLPVGVDGLALAWRMPSSGALEGAGIGFGRNAAGVMRGTCMHFEAKHGPSTVALDGGEIETDEAGALKRVAAATMTLTHARPIEKKAAPAPIASAEEPPPPLPSATRGKAKAKVAGKAAPPPVAPAADAEPVLPLPELHALRARIGALTTSLGGRVPDGTKIDIGGLAVKVDIGGEPFAFGPGPFALERRADRVHLSFTSESTTAEPKKEGQAGTPLSFDADLPLGAGDVTAHLSGGPVSLARLGVKEGTKGLFDVQHGMVSGKGQLVLAAAGDALTFDGSIALKSIGINQPRLSHDPLKNLDLAVAAKGNLDDVGRLRIDDAELDMGALHVKARGNVEETREHFGASLSVDVTPAACQALLDSTPRGLLPIVQQVRMSGTFGATGRVVFDSRAFEKLTLEYTIDDRCKVVEVPRELSKERFAGSFTYRTYKPDGVATETTTGPTSSSWTNIDDISPFMIAAVLTTEDGAFYKHHGFNHAAIKNSVAANLKAKRFVRGASTITMQLAKNLFLSREKTLSRKIEEVLLTDYLEQIFRKEDMMELYLNVIEFGPDVYGITRAADFYFGRRPEELNVGECFFLASLLPSPIRYGRQRDKGQVSEAWGRHLSTLMEIAAKNNKITQAELTEGLATPVTFVKPGDPKPEPRKPARSDLRRRDGSDDAGWQPLE